MLILTPNRRLAAFAKRFYNQEQAQKGNSCWPSLEIFPYKIWYLQLWQLCLENFSERYMPLLSDTQQQILMERIIQRSSVGSELLRLGSTAATVLQAWTFVHQWQLTMDQVSNYAEFDQDAATFCLWAGEYQAWLNENQYVDFELMLLMLIDLLPELVHMLPQQIKLLGMHDLPPLHKIILTRLMELGVTFHQSDLLMPEIPQVVRHGLQDPEQEWHAAAQWADNLIKQGDQEIIGVVIPELGMQRVPVSAVFAKYISSNKINMSAPLKLAAYNLINIGLLLLQTAKPRIEFQEFSLIIRSTYIKSATLYVNERALLDAKLRAELDGTVSWAQMAQIADRLDVDLATILLSISDTIDALKGLHSPHYWVAQIDTILCLWGWPGGGILDRQQQDLVACWFDLLDKYARLSFIIPEQTFAQAVQSIVRLASETDFLPAETGETRVHVLGVLEADGLLFDQLWVSGMSQDMWPMEAAPNPYIPIELQIAHDLPKSTAQRELKIAKRLTANFERGASKQVIFSYPMMVDQTPAKPSTLISHIPEQLYFINRPKEQVRLDQLEWIADHHGSIFNFDRIPSGSRALELQIKCPFSAYSYIRLKANKLEQPKKFLTARQRGSLMHLVMERFWLKCKDSQQLLAWWPLQAELELRGVVLSVIDEFKKSLPNIFDQNFTAIEIKRVFDIAWRWLQYETKRESFIVVGLEKEVEVLFDNVKLRLRIDRIDQIEGDGLIIIDYKTGAVSNTTWLELPITAPQLPLYAYTMLDQVVGLVYADLSTGGIKFIGAAIEKNVLPGIKEFPRTFAEQTQIWKQALIVAVNKFIQGDATVNPLNPQVCLACDLQMMCRIYGE